jgi:CRISPR-associated protein Cmr2
MNNYIAITIGPIYKTFLNARKTREVWAASYMFSFLMKTIIQELITASIDKDKFIIPAVTPEALIYKGAGLFPDRIIFESEEGDFIKAETSIRNAIKKFSGYFPGDQDKVREYLEEYLRFCPLEKSLENGCNLIEDLYLHMDTLELLNKPLNETNANKNYLIDFFRKINKNNFFKENCYGIEDVVDVELKLLDINEQKRFESLVEISTRDLKFENEIHENHDINKTLSYKQLVNKYLWSDIEGDTDNDQLFIEAMKSGLPGKFKNYHKYIAILKADGDKIGSTIKNLKGDVDRLKSFSKDLLGWAIETDKIVRRYGGIPIYIGGDDLLLFAPVAKGNQTIIDLVNEIDKSFVARFKAYLNNKSEHPTLSYGIAINYYKFPLFEAIGKVDELLYEAKNYSEARNAVCIRVLKHSGSELKAVFTKSDTDSKSQFENILRHLGNDRLENSFLSSVTYKLRDNEKVIDILEKNSNRIENFFDNNYDDYDRIETKRNKKGKYLFAVEQLLINSIEEAEKHRIHFLKNNPDNEKMINTSKSELALEKVYSTLKISRFIKGMDDEK